MNVVTVHNLYKLPGGEDVVFRQESALLADRGHVVTRYVVANDNVDQLSGLSLAGRTIWSWPSFRELRALFRRTKADVAHFHNTMPLVSPAAYYAAAAEKVAVVQTLHNYRLLCPGNNLFRDGAPCERCVDRVIPWPSVKYRCYRANRIATLGVATMLSVHRAAGTWRNRVHAFICLTAFARAKFLRGGIPEERLYTKAHFVDPDPGPGPGDGGYALYVGRLEEGKGVRTLLDAWREDLPMTLVIAGTGPLEEQVREAAQSQTNVEYLGWVKPAQVTTLLQRAGMLVFPSLFYEGLPTSVLQSLATGTPIVATNSPNLAGLITHRKTGLLFPARDAEALRRRIRWFSEHPEAVQVMRRACRQDYLAKYTADRGYTNLMAVYESALMTSYGRSVEPLTVAV